jgi:hypothetical protein
LLASLAILASTLVLLVVPSASAVDTSAAKVSTVQRVVKRNVQVLAHRCLHREDRRYENSEHALRLIAAVKRRFHARLGCETDITRLRGPNGRPGTGISVVHHDETVGGVYTTASVRAAGLTTSTAMINVTYAQWRVLRIKGGVRPVTAIRMFRLAKRLRVPLMVELKFGISPEAQAVAAEYAGIRFYAYPQDPAGNNPCSLDALRRLGEAGFSISLKYSEGCPKPPEKLAAEHYRIVFYPHPTTALVSQGKTHGYKVGNFNGRTITNANRTWRAGAQVIITSIPGRVVKAGYGRRR